MQHTATRHAAALGTFLDGIRDQSRRGAMARHDAHQALRNEDPVLALICEIEAHADQRLRANDCANSKLTTIRGLAREAMVKLTGSDANPIYPPAPNGSPTDRWSKVFGS